MALPRDLWIRVLDRVEASCDAAALACVSRESNAAYRASSAFRAVRVSPRSGEVREPASGTFDVEVDVEDDLVKALAQREGPRRLSVLMRPGTYDPFDWTQLPLEGVHIFGREAVRVLAGAPLLVGSCPLTVDGVEFVVPKFSFTGVCCLRMQRCAARLCIVNLCENGTAVFDRCRFSFSRINANAPGVTIRCHRCTFANCTVGAGEGSATLVKNTFTNCASGSYAMWVGPSSSSSSSVLIADNEFSGVGVGVGVNLVRATDVAIERNAFRGYRNAIQMSEDSDARIVGNTFAVNHLALAIFSSSRAFLDANDGDASVYKDYERTHVYGNGIRFHRCHREWSPRLRFFAQVCVFAVFFAVVMHAG